MCTQGLNSDTTCSHTTMNYQLYQKFKLIENDESNHLIIISNKILDL
jgi:hypothetical protein